MAKSALQAYSEYQNIEYDYVDKLPVGWKLLPNIALFEERIDKGHSDEELLSVTIGKGVVKQIDIDKKDTSNADKTKYKLVHVGDFVYSMRFRQGASGFSHYRGLVSTVCTVLKSKAEINSSFFHFVLRTPYYRNYAERYSYGIADGQLPLRYKDFKRMYSVVPPLKTQNKIVEFLNRKTQQAERFIQKQSHLIELLEEQKKAIINKAVTQGIEPDVEMKDSEIELLGNIPTHWNVMKLSHVTKILRGRFSHRPRNDPFLYDGKFPFIQTGDVAQANKYVETYSQSLNKFGFRVSKEFPSGTLVMTIAANIGDIAILRFKACFPDSIVGFFPYKKMDLNYLYYSLKSLKDEFIKQSPVSTQANLRVEIIGAMKIAVPPIKEQREIYSFIEAQNQQIDALIQQAKSEIKLSKEYLDSLVYQVVTGQLEVNT